MSYQGYFKIYAQGNRHHTPAFMNNRWLAENSGVDPPVKVLSSHQIISIVFL
jgi:hypothetical protein